MHLITLRQRSLMTSDVTAHLASQTCSDETIMKQPNTMYSFTTESPMHILSPLVQGHHRGLRSNGPRQMNYSWHLGTELLIKGEQQSFNNGKQVCTQVDSFPMFEETQLYPSSPCLLFPSFSLKSLTGIRDTRTGFIGHIRNLTVN